MQITPEILFLTQEDILATGFGMKDALEAVEEALKLQSEGKVLLPSKTILDLGEREHGRINAMPAYLGDGIDMCGIKWIAGFPGNPKTFGIPRAHAMIVLNDSNTGVPVAIMDGTYLSALRTGAVSGVGAKYLAGTNNEVLCIIGCGVQSYTQVMGVIHNIPHLKKVKLFDVISENAAKLGSWIEKEYEVETEVVENAEAAVRKSDIIITATVSDKPIVMESWIGSGSLVIHVGSYQEEEERVITEADKIVVDNWEEVKHRKTPLLAQLHERGAIRDKDISANLGDVIIGTKTGRENEHERIYFAPLGLAIEDISVGTLVYRKAKSMNLGQTLTLWSQPIEWMHP